MKKATVIGPETNELMEKRLSMEQLEMVSGGEEEEENGFLREYYIRKIVVYFKGMLKWLRPKSLNLFWAFITQQDSIIAMAILAFNKPAGIVYYTMSWNEKYNAAEKAWNSR